jgi:hypothetical protein
MVSIRYDISPEGPAVQSPVDLDLSLPVTVILVTVISASDII